MQNTEAEQLFSRGLRAIEAGDMLVALVSFEQLVQLDDKPVYSSYLAFCIARERGQIKRGTALCEEAIEKEPENSLHYLNLGRIQLMASLKEEAVKTFRKGLSREPNKQILREIRKIEPRRQPVVSFLSRKNPLNKYLGITMKRLGMR